MKVHVLEQILKAVDGYYGNNGEIEFSDEYGNIFDIVSFWQGENNFTLIGKPREEVE